MTASLTVLKAGMLTTVQDLGRHGYQGLGVPVSGPMDPYSHRLANLVLGNDPMAAALEITLMGPELVADGAVSCAIAGADIETTVDGRPIGPNVPFAVPSGGRIRFGAHRRGARVSLAVRGGFEVPATLGSRATHLVSRMGPFGGRALKTGDVLPVGQALAPRAAGSQPPLPLELPQRSARLRIVPAVHRDRFTDDSWGLLVRAEFLVTPQSNRMGYRLEGPTLAHVGSAEILSEAMPLGAIQVPASGQPILLLAERATTGGYATIATVIAADIPIAGQLAPGDRMSFDAVSRSDAIEALRRREADLTGAEPESGEDRNRV